MSHSQPQRGVSASRTPLQIRQHNALQSRNGARQASTPPSQTSSFKLHDGATWRPTSLFPIDSVLY